MLLVDPKVEPKASWTFSAEILILYHSTSVQLNYQPVVHIGTVRQVLNLDWNLGKFGHILLHVGHRLLHFGHILLRFGHI